MMLNRNLQVAKTAVHPGEEQASMSEWNRYFHFKVQWHGNQGNAYLTIKLRKQVDALLQKFAEEHQGVGNVNKITQVKSEGLSY